MLPSSHSLSPSTRNVPSRGSESHSIPSTIGVLGVAALTGYLVAVATTPATGFEPTAARPAAVAAEVPVGPHQPALRTAIETSLPEETMSRLSAEPEAPVFVPDPDPNLSSAPPLPVSDASATCPAGMKLVEGEYCPSVAHRCLDYLNVARDRCAEYAEGHRCFGKPAPMRFCIDQFEYPNVRGVKPERAVSYQEAAAKCVEQGKRLCTANEWTLACEGPERLPYPTGRLRDENACNYDRQYRFPDNDAYANPRTRAAEVKRLDQSVASGEMAECVSPYGVHDMTGNVDEWVFNESGSSESRPYVSGLKGGYWGPVRNRCRPMTVDHNEWHSGYQIGFRCCADGQDQSSGQPTEPETGEVRALADTDEAPAVADDLVSG